MAAPRLKEGGREKSAGGAGAAVRCSAGRGAHAPCGEQGEARWGGSGTGTGRGEAGAAPGRRAGPFSRATGMRQHQGVWGLELPELRPSPGSLSLHVGTSAFHPLRRRTAAPPGQPQLMIDTRGPVHCPAGPPLLGDRAEFPRYSGHTLPPLPGDRAGSSRQPRISPACPERGCGTSSTAV